MKPERHQATSRKPRLIRRQAYRACRWLQGRVSRVISLPITCRYTEWLE